MFPFLRSSYYSLATLCDVACKVGGLIFGISTHAALVRGIALANEPPFLLHFPVSSYVFFSEKLCCAATPVWSRNVLRRASQVSLEVLRLPDSRFAVATVVCIERATTRVGGFEMSYEGFGIEELCDAKPTLAISDRHRGLRLARARVRRCLSIRLFGWAGARRRRR